MNILDGKAALVTGASRGIGRVLAVGLAQHGADVVVNYKCDASSAAETCRLIERLGRRALPIQSDVGCPGAAAALVARAVEGFGRLDVLVNNASVKLMRSAEEITDALFDEVVNTNLRGPFFASVSAAREMRATGGGSIINISSCAARLMVKSHSVYTMSKGGLEALTRQLAFEFAPSVRVNAIAPGATDVASSREFDPALNEHWGPVTPMGRAGQPEDYVGPLIFLAGDGSAYITGEIMHVDGGWTIGGNSPPLPNN